MLWLIGFGPAGVAAGSFAAAWQSSVGNVVARSLFAGIFYSLYNYFEMDFCEY